VKEAPVRTAVALAFLAVLLVAGPTAAQAPIEDELVLQTPVSKFIVDAALKAFSDYAKEKWNVTVKTNAQYAGTPVSYGRIVEWKGKPEADIFWGGESALFDKLAEQKLLVKHEVARELAESIPASIGKPKPIPLKDPGGFWIGTALEPYGLVYHPRLIRRLGAPEPKDWEDLLHPKLKGNVAQCAPTRSSSSHATYEIILQVRGEQPGWEWLKRLGGNTGIFTARSRGSRCRPTWPSRRCWPASTSSSWPRRTPSSRRSPWRSWPGRSIRRRPGRSSSSY
jgi:ABC-type thiamine transport system substrate-binding protein